jgi:lipopolysaccharide cholinephosphotransferase
MRIVNEDGLEYYVIDRIEDIQSQMLKLLKIIDNICMENGLQYFLDGGTAIGAYRHGGFIPWDDDLDICMLKNDYLKLIAILKEMDRSKYFLFDYDQNLHPCAFFGEKVKFFSCADGKRRHIYPIKIDIIPLNIIENNEESCRKNRVLRELCNLVIYGKCNEEFKQEAIECLQHRFEGDKRKFIAFYNLNYGLGENFESSLLARPSMTFSTPKVYRYTDMFPLKEIEFSGIKSYVPATDIWLRDIYGDYMKFPEIEDRKPEASKVFDVWNEKPLYKYLIDKTPKSILQKMIFAFKANILCK